MSLMPESLRQWWQQREPRERKILSVFLLFIIGFGIYKGVLEPVVGGYWEVRERADTAYKDYRWFQDQVILLNKIKMEAGGIMPSIITAGNLKREIEEEFDRTKISAYIEIISRGEQEMVEIEVSGTDGGRLMRWLEGMSNKGRTIQAFDLRNNAGKLSGTILLSGG